MSEPDRTIAAGTQSAGSIRGPASVAGVAIEETFA
jgi:hypothetical protein